MITIDAIKKLEKEAIELNGKFGVVTMICPHCEMLVATNYVPYKKALEELAKQEGPEK